MKVLEIKEPLRQTGENEGLCLGTEELGIHTLEGLLFLK